MKLQVLQFGVFPPPEGGVQANVKDIRDYLRARDIRCGVINLSRHRQKNADDLFYPKTPFQVLKTALGFPANVWHFHLGGQVTRSLLGLYAIATSIPSKKTVLTFHSGGYPSSPDAQLSNPVRDLVFRRFDRIIAVNAEIVKMFLRIGVPSEKVRLISPFSMPLELPPIEIPPAILAFIASHTPLLLSVCLLEPEYDIAMQVEAMAGILTRFPGAGLLVIGAGSLEDKLRSQIASKTYANSLLLCGNVPRAATLKIMAKADALLRTTWYDGDAVSVREALHLGVPIIASDNGMRPLGVNLIPPRDPQALVEKLEAVLNEPRVPETKKPGSVENLTAVFDLYRELV